jgi:dTDP-4-amino-4,6-dideoxygalactose transaminase
MAKGVHKITYEFEKAIAKYTCARYCVCLDNASNAVFLSLIYQGVASKRIEIPRHTYPSIPCEIIHAGATVGFYDWLNNGSKLKGAYQLGDTRTWDSALRFTWNMYIPHSFMCLSFTGPYKRLKLGKGGAILTDDPKAYKWFKRARFSGRRECSYFVDDFDFIGWNMYMLPELAAKGLSLMPQFYEVDGETPIPQPDIELSYPDLSKYAIYTKRRSIDEMIGWHK